MPGSTPNSNILDAIDELIKAINDLGNRPVLVQGGCSCCGGGGYAPPLAPDTDPIEGGAPPEGYTEYTPSVDITACKKAAFVYFGILEVLNNLKKYENTIEVGFDVAVGMMSWALARSGGLGALIAAKIGGVTSLITSFTNTTTDLEDLITIWTEQQDALLCVLYNAASEGSGASYSGTLLEINGILSGAGSTTGNLAVISSILTVETLIILWYNPTYRDVTIEQQIIDYTLPEGVDCEGCGPVSEINVIYGTVVSDVTENGQRTLTIDSEDVNTVSVIRIDAAGHVLYTGGATSCFEVISITEISHNNPPYLQFRRFTCGGEYQESANDPPDTTLSNYFNGQCLEYMQVFDNAGEVFRLEIVLDDSSCL